MGICWNLPFAVPFEASRSRSPGFPRPHGSSDTTQQASQEAIQGDIIWEELDDEVELLGVNPKIWEKYTPK